MGFGEGGLAGSVLELGLAVRSKAKPEPKPKSELAHKEAQPCYRECPYAARHGCYDPEMDRDTTRNTGNPRWIGLQHGAIRIVPSTCMMGSVRRLELGMFVFWLIASCSFRALTGLV